MHCFILQLFYFLVCSATNETDLDRSNSSKTQGNDEPWNDERGNNEQGDDRVMVKWTKTNQTTLNKNQVMMPHLIVKVRTCKIWINIILCSGLFLWV